MTGVITSTGKNLMWKRLYGAASISQVDKFRIGVSSTTPNTGDTDVNSLVPITPQLINTCDTPGDWTKSADAIVPTTNTDSYKEGYGITDKTSLNIGKSGTTEAFIYYYDTVAIDMSGTKPYMWAWLNVKDAATLAKITNVQLYVREAANYRYWETSGATLSVGWNLLSTGVFTSFSGESGTPPDLSAIDKVELRVNVTNAATTVTLGDLGMDFFHWDLYANTDGSVLSGYPTYNTGENKATFRGFISSVQALGYELAEVAEFNDDTTPQIFSHDTFTAFEKTSEVEIHFILIHELLDV